MLGSPADRRKGEVARNSADAAVEVEGVVGDMVREDWWPPWWWWW